MSVSPSPITTAFTAQSTADEVVAGVDLSGTRAVVTGAASGIGVETARSLARAGAEVTLAVRDTAAGARVARDLTATTGNDDIRVAHLDLADRSSVGRFLADWNGPLHLLVNNAGIMATPETRTAEGWELQFATNHLGHFALALGLHAALAAGAAERGGSRVVALSSAGHMYSPVHFDDLHFHRRPYDPMLAYGRSKTAVVLFAVEATRRWADDGITANAVNPGGISTGLQRHFPRELREEFARHEAAGVFRYKTVRQGAATTLVAAVAPEFANTGGHYLDDAREAYTVPDDADPAEHPHAVKRWALDPAAAERLWSVSAELLRAAA
ncbi:oxidoreductase [Streptomyces carminius]|uniref:Probable oxidoreductase n=1 Tax=Streptomyces carminius TaxID=2665496 RepID=A0A2M8LRE7_9ACTN|nr:SDR family NAD(P)-dependent oxidoreductase [Streptomyces carminius]PJE94499.1 oxidoreductase [Streptomyces carminius]